MKIKQASALKYGLLTLCVAAAAWAWLAYESIPTSAVLLAAPVTFTENGTVVSLDATPYWDHTPPSIDRIRKRSKCLSGHLAVRMSLLGSERLQGSMVILSAWVHQNGRWASLTVDDIDKSERGRGEFRAYGCASNLFKTNLQVDSIVKLRLNGRTFYLRAIPQLLREKV